MAFNSASGSTLAELKEELNGLKAQMVAELNTEQGARDLVLRELNEDLDRAQAAITALSSGELHLSQRLPHNPLGIAWPYGKSIRLACNIHLWRFSP